MTADDGVRPRLGRGLAALIGDVADDGQNGAGRGPTGRLVAVEFLRPNPRNPRRSFGQDELDELTASIKARGVIQPIVARALAGVPGTYEIVAGERRWRASQAAGLTEVPVVVVEIDDRASLEYAILENVQRADLNALEEAAGYERLMGEFGYTQKELADILGKSRSHVANTLRLLHLPRAIRDRVAAGEISAGHARALLGVSDPETVALRVVLEGLSVREVEALAAAEAEAAASETAGPGRRPRGGLTRFPALRIYEHALARAFGGLTVRVAQKASGAGEIRVQFASPEELRAFCARFNVRPDE